MTKIESLYWRVMLFGVLLGLNVGEAVEMAIRVGYGTEYARSILAGSSVWPTVALILNSLAAAIMGAHLLQLRRRLRLSKEERLG